MRRRAKHYAFIITFRPERYPLGAPYRLNNGDEPSIDELTNNTTVTLPDEDAGPTKAWIVSHRKDPEWASYYEHAYGLRPREQFFDLRKDPFEMKNVVNDPEYAEVVKQLRSQLMNELESTGDPRLIDDGKFFETPPMAGPIPEDAQMPRRNNNKKPQPKKN